MSQPYLSLEAELHDAFWQAEDGGSEVALMAEFLRSHPGRALEIGSGSGRLLLPLLRAGHPVEGLELSPDMLALCRAHAARQRLAVPLHQGDMSSWIPDSPYQALLAPAFTLQLAEDPAATLRHWHGWLHPGGGLYLTLFIPYAELEGDLPAGVWYDDHQASLPGGRSARLTTRHRLDSDRQILHREHRYQLAGSPPRTFASRQSLRWFEHPQILGLLREAGFQVLSWMADFQPGQPVTDPESLEFDGILTYLVRKAPKECLPPNHAISD